MEKKAYLDALQRALQMEEEMVVMLVALCESGVLGPLSDVEDLRHIGDALKGIRDDSVNHRGIVSNLVRETSRSESRNDE